MIAIVDYGVGNLKSVYKALERLGFTATITSDKGVIRESKAIILPGVGAFHDAMDNLRESGLKETILESVSCGTPILGICLGMQLLYEKSYEDGEFEGLGLLKGEVVRFSEDLKVPHMGWNELKINDDKRDEAIIQYIEEGEYVYFVHSYYAKTDFSNVIAYAEYGVDVPAVVGEGNVYGMQFHPEKSGKTGLNLLKAFGEMIK